MAFLITLYGCGRHVEELEDADCEPGPVVHEIVWKMDVNGQNASVTVKPGDTVRWVWGEDDMPHDVSSTDANAPDGFGSEILTGEGQVYEFTFTEETTFEYRCSVHPDSMFGTITVVVCEE